MMPCAKAKAIAVGVSGLAFWKRITMKRSSSAFQPLQRLFEVLVVAKKKREKRARRDRTEPIPDQPLSILVLGNLRSLFNGL